MPRHATKEHLEERMELYRAGLSDNQIAKKLGVKANTIYYWRRKRGLPVNNSMHENQKNRKTPGELLTERNAEARAHNMSYGKYWAMKREESKTT